MPESRIQVTSHKSPVTHFEFRISYASEVFIRGQGAAHPPHFPFLTTFPIFPLDGGGS